MASPHNDTYAEDVMPSHAGHPILRSDRLQRILILCPLGHLIHSVASKDWPGSAWESKAGDPAWVVTCRGTVVRG